MEGRRAMEVYQPRIVEGRAAACVLGAGLRLVSWTVNDVVEGIRLRLLGVEGFTTDHPQAMRDALFID